MRISVSPSATGTIAIKLISAAQRQSGSSVEPATSRRSNFDMTPPIPIGKCMSVRHRSPSELIGFSPWTLPPLPAALPVIVITEQTGVSGPNLSYEHRGIRYAVRIGIARNQWRVAINIPDKRLPVERTVFGTYKDAETTAHSMINAWLKKQSAAAR